MVEFYEIFFSNGAYRALRYSQSISDNAPFVVEVFKGDLDKYHIQDISLKIYSKGKLEDIVIRDWTFPFCLTGKIYNRALWGEGSIEGRSKKGLEHKISARASSCSVVELIETLFSRIHILSYCDDISDYKLFVSPPKVQDWGKYVNTVNEVNLEKLSAEVGRLYKMQQAIAKYGSNPEVAESNFYKEITKVFAESQRRLATLLSAQG